MFNNCIYIVISRMYIDVYVCVCVCNKCIKERLDILELDSGAKQACVATNQSAPIAQS